MKSSVFSPIIGYRSGKELKLARVVQARRDKYLVIDDKGRTESVKPDRLVVEFDKTAADSDFQSLLQTVAEKAAELEVDLLWEMFVDEEVELDGRRAAEEYFNSTSPIEIAATEKALSGAELRFRRKGSSFIPRPRNEVEDLLLREQRKAEKAAFRKQAEDFFKKVLRQENPVLEDFSTQEENIIRRLESFMFRDQNPETEEWLSTVSGGRPEREAGLEILEKLGRLNQNVDSQLLLYGIVAEFSEPVRQRVAELTSFQAETGGETGRGDYRRYYTFSVDDESTEEIDDALSLQQLDDGSIEVGIHIADPNVFVEKGDCLDQAAADRALSLYLPTSTVTMLPERLGCDLASLKQGEDRPSISVFVVLEEDGRIRDFSVRLGVVKLARRLTYAEVDEILVESEESSVSEDDSLSEALRGLSRLASALQEKRRRAGALLFPRPEMAVTVKNDQVSVKRIDAQSRARTMVSEFMVLVNRLVAEFALARDIPIIYRIQPEPEGAIESLSKYDPVLFDRSIRKMRPTRFSTHPQPHSSLALDAYTQISSPLRRFADLAIQRQVAAYLTGGIAPYSVSELIEVAGRAENVERANKKIEREVNNYWLMEAIRRRQSRDSLSATVVDPIGNKKLAELDDFMVRGILRGGDKYKSGARIRVRVVEVRPRKGYMLLEPAG